MTQIFKFSQSQMGGLYSSSCFEFHTSPKDSSIYTRLKEWILFAIFAGCPQHLGASVAHLIFLVTLSLISLKKLITFWLDKRYNNGAGQKGPSITAPRSKPHLVQINSLFKSTFFICLIMSLGYMGLVVWRAWVAFLEPVSYVEQLFSATEALAWIAFTMILWHEKIHCALRHPSVIRIWWVFHFLFSAAGLNSALWRFFNGIDVSNDNQLTMDDAFAVPTFLATLFLLVVAIKGKTGVFENGQFDGLREPLVKQGAIEGIHESVPVTGYATASLFSRAIWQWINPLLRNGSKNTLQIDEIPTLSPDDRAESMSALFQSRWSKNPGIHAVRSTLFRCFWPQLLFTGFVALVRVLVMYVGPVLIQRFVDYTSGKGDSVYEGYYLVLLLLSAKSIEVLASHQYNFHSQKLGMNIRTAIITAVYRKGLRLSNSSRQAHGVGQIVNYMVVDGQQLSDVILQLHNLWVLPLQVCVALGILYSVLGTPMFAGFVVMITVVSINFYCSKQQRRFQTEVMKQRDERMKATTEVLNFMKIIKFQAWEEHFRQRIESFRRIEYSWLTKFMISVASNIFVLWICPTVVSTVTFAACILLKRELTPGRVFTATATFRILQEPIRLFPQSLISISQALVSLDRLDRYMRSGELDTAAAEKLPADPASAVSVENGCFSWEEEETNPVLSNIDVNVKPGWLVTIVGAVGSGKSSMLAALLGEMHKISGKVRTHGTTAYVSQGAWIQNGTIEDNILFGQPMDRERYKKTMSVCALEPDMGLMEYGDQTEIGERGINLSGGQKQRIQLARAVYQDSDIYLLDDIFSAVDAHTGSKLFKECVRGILRRKTILLVTHQVEFLHGADLILVMRDGKIVQSGTYRELLKGGTDLDTLVAAHKDAMASIQSDSSSHNNPQTLEMQDWEVESSEACDINYIATLIEDSTNPNHTCTNQKRSPTKALSFSNRNSFKSQSATTLSHQHEPPSDNSRQNSGSKKGSSKLIDDEKREAGRVGWRIYWLYLTKAFGWPLLFLLIFVQAVWQVLLVSSDYWLANETSVDQQKDFDSSRFISVYFWIASGTWVCVIIRTILVTTLGLKTAQTFYLDMLRRIFRAPMAFFDTTPSGRILSRSSTDQTTLDVILPFFCGGSLALYFATIGVVVVTCQVTWPIIFVIAPLGWLYLSYQAYFIVTSRELTRLDSITKAPVIHHFSETVAGLMTIRCFQKQEQFIKANLDRVNTNIRMDFHNNAANEWLGYRVEMTGTIVLCSTALLFVALPLNMIKPELVGLSLSYGLALNACLYWSIWLTCNVENKMVSVERIRQYTEIESEAPLVIMECRPPQEWPPEGTITMIDLQLRYRTNTPLVLKGISLSITGGQKVGVVGRTGSGKSTLVQALFRLVEPSGGQILIDGIDITKIGLSDLRSRFGIIPQEPTMFEGTIRSNIDPLDQYTEDEIWEGLEKCQLADIVKQKPEKLDSSVVDNGDNWSVGQKQLFSLGRALLKRSRILFLDEATASVDSQTDGVIQKTIRDEFATSTVISIAHRIPSVMDSDFVLVMDAGKVKEFDRPARLLEQPKSVFSALVREYTSRSGKS
ncbi:hypothetical protein O6H91_03G113100 [Diphasiastrum complanatum]|uniref:Uncharacterized protein n=1 Tax=Diphasiastrum complanatum TaxID=34168 RepID=A0ACC2EAG4_DIPCM|nr:hypothetical protein O6H91_03G113100 [Diphasiastrum complanatum]